MIRRTPVLALVLAPVALLLIVILWNSALVPLYRSVWYSDTVLQWRLDSSRPEARSSAASDIAGTRTDDPGLIAALVTHAQIDESADVREAAIIALGWVGSQRPLPDGALQALISLALHEQDVVLLSAVMRSVGASAVQNEYPDSVARRIVNVLQERHPASLHPGAAAALGQLGAAQPLSDAVFAELNLLFVDPSRPGERESLAMAFVEIAKGHGLPRTTLDTLAVAFESESNGRIRASIVYTLAYSARDYPPASALVAAAVGDPHRDVVGAAEHGLRIIEAERNFADRDPLVLAMDTSRPVELRVRALGIVRSSRIDPAAYEQIVALASDPVTDVAVTALGLFRYLARAPDDDFDRQVLIPALTRAMSDSDPSIREAAYGALSTIAGSRPEYPRAADFPALLEAGANDASAKVRVVVLAAMLRDAGSAAHRDAILERGIMDSDPYVRAYVVSWLGSPKTKTARRQEFLDRASSDPDPGVRTTATTSRQSWESRDRWWPVEQWKLLLAGEFSQVGMAVLIAVTVAAPVLVFVIFLIYYMARLLTYLQQRRWRGAAAIAVMVAWAGASYGMFMLYFIAALAGDQKTGELLMLAGFLWAAVAAYAALGWGLHFLVRR